MTNEQRDQVRYLLDNSDTSNWETNFLDNLFKYWWDRDISDKQNKALNRIFDERSL